MRNILLLVLGIAIGAVAAGSVLNAVSRRDAYPRGLMNVIQHHYVAVREDLRNRQCADAPKHLDRLRTFSADIESAMYPDGSAEPPFREFERRLNDALNAAGTSQDCAALSEPVSKITAACDACHQQYR